MAVHTIPMLLLVFMLAHCTDVPDDKNTNVSFDNLRNEVKKNAQIVVDFVLKYITADTSDTSEEIKHFKTELENAVKPKQPANIANYDFILDVKHLDDLKTGWKLSFDTKDKKEIWKKTMISPWIWGIYGSKFNVGKTWFTGKLLDNDFGAGYTDQFITKGLSFIHHKDQQFGSILVVDSMGKDRPVPDTTVHQRVTMDDFVMEFLMMLSRRFFYVVPTLGASDIENTNLIISKAFMKNSNLLEINVIHNFQELSDVKDVEFHVDKDIVEAFSVEKEMSEEKCNDSIKEFENQYSDKKHKQPAYKAESGTCRFYAQETAPGVWKNLKAKGRFQTDVSHYVLAREGSSAANEYNSRTIEALKAKLKGDMSMNTNFPFLQTVIDNVTAILYTHLYTPEEVKSGIIPVALNIAEVVYQPGGFRTYFYNKLKDIVSTFVILFEQANEIVSGIWKSVMGADNSTVSDPFELVIVDGDNNTLVLKFARPLPDKLVYAPLSAQFQVDKFYEPKVDILDSENAILYVIDMAGVPSGSVTVKCVIGRQQFYVYGMKPIPQIYSKFIKDTSNIIQNERRFSSFSFSITIPNDAVCISPLTVYFENGACYVFIPKQKNKLGEAHPVGPYSKDEF